VPWFRVPLKTARLAVRVISMIQDEARASRLSFADVAKRLTELPETDACFVSKKVGAAGGACAQYGNACRCCHVLLLPGMRLYAAPAPAPQRPPAASC
jgi:hypothetical protein